VAADSGYLAVKSLGDLPPPAKRLQIALLTGSAIMIVAVTLAIGYLADKSEQKVDDRADRAEQALATLKSGQALSLVDLDKASAQMQLLGTQMEDKSRNPHDTVRIQKSFNSIQTLLNAASRSITQGSVLLSTTPPPSAPQPINLPAVEQDLEYLRSQLIDMDRDQTQTMIATIGGMRQDYLNAYADYSREHPGLPVSIDPERQQQLDKIFQSARPSIQNRLDSRDKRFNDMVPSIESARTKALQFLQNRVDRKTDATTFDAALADAKKRVVIPDSWNGAAFLYTLNYVPMENYLSTLDQQIKDGR
jgi:F0F1-type ATP synthase membrane subunit b/b'